MHSQDIERKRNSDVILSAMYRRKWTLSNPKLDVVNSNACEKFSQNSFIHTQDTERKRNSDIIQGP